MSSTNRGAVRNPSDYYVTPIHKVEQFLRAWAKDEPALKQVRAVLDPCAGGTVGDDGKELLPMSYPVALARCADCFPCIEEIITRDIREDSPAVVKGDYLQTPDASRPQIIITNPPFNLALPIIQKALREVANGGFVVMLLRLNWFGSDARWPFLTANMPARAYVFSKRFAFTPSGKGTTDSIEYCHMVWQQGSTTTETRLKLI